MKKKTMKPIHNAIMALTWCVVLVSILMIQGCEKNNPQPQQQPQETGNDVCKCGEVVSINQYYPSTDFTYVLVNNCTGNETTTTDSEYYDYGLTMCLEYEW